MRLEARLRQDGPLQIEQVDREYPSLVLRILRVDEGFAASSPHAEEGPVSLPFVREKAR